MSFKLEEVFTKGSFGYDFANLFLSGSKS